MRTGRPVATLTYVYLDLQGCHGDSGSPLLPGWDGTGAAGPKPPPAHPAEPQCRPEEGRRCSAGRWASASTPTLSFPSLQDPSYLVILPLLIWHSVVLLLPLSRFLNLNFT